MKKLLIVLAAIAVALLVGSLSITTCGFVFPWDSCEQTPAVAVEKVSVHDNVVKSGVLRCCCVNRLPYYLVNSKYDNNTP